MRKSIGVKQKMSAYEKIVLFSLSALALVQFKMAVSLQDVDKIRDELSQAGGW